LFGFLLFIRYAARMRPGECGRANAAVECGLLGWARGATLPDLQRAGQFGWHDKREPL
jgi:hypothetical protein